MPNSTATKTTETTAAQAKAQARIAWTKEQNSPNVYGVKFGGTWGTIGKLMFELSQRLLDGTLAEHDRLAQSYMTELALLFGGERMAVQGINFGSISDNGIISAIAAKLESAKKVDGTPCYRICMFLSKFEKLAFKGSFPFGAKQQSLELSNDLEVWFHKPSYSWNTEYDKAHPVTK